MKKKQLQEMKKLNATPSMMKYAAADVLAERKRTYWGTEKGYLVGRYLRCTEERGILKVSVFLTEHMKSGGNLPVYELYMDKENMAFITYDCIKQKWVESKLDVLSWPRYVYASANDWISENDYSLTKRYLNIGKGGFEGLLEFQRKIRTFQLEARHRRITGAWDQELAQTRDLPKDWNLWVQKVGIPHNFIFYHYERKGAKTGYCSYCEKEVPIQNPRNNKPGVCPKCNHEITFKAIGKMGYFHTPTVSAYLMQRCKDGFMLREFRGYKTYYRGKYKEPHVYIHEERRVLYDHEAKPVSAYWWGVYKQRNSRWIKGSLCEASLMLRHDGRVYGKTMPSLFKKELIGTGLQAMLAKHPFMDPEIYLAFTAKVPYLERMMKAELPVLVKECFHSPGQYQSLFSGSEETSLTKALGIDTPRMKRLRASGKGIAYLSWLRYEKLHNTVLDESLISWFLDNGATPATYNFLNDNMSMQKIHNYICRQMKENLQDYNWVLSTWRDTLSMAKRLNKKLNDPYVFRPADLHGRHQEYVRKINEQNEERLAEEQAKKFPKVNDICTSIQKLYSYSNDKYMIVVPKNILDIVREGKNLEHCVGDDRYMERIERQESYVLFLRRRSRPNTAYYTLEVEPNGTIRQKRTLGDVQKDDLIPATKFLQEWQQEISKRLTPAERRLAVRSKELRQEAFADMEKNHTIIRTGVLRGQLLRDVLMADLMENTEAAAEPVLAAAA